MWYDVCVKNDITDLDVVRARAENFYKSLGPVFCPYLKASVHFNAQGLEHMKFKRRDKARLPQDQYMRFKLVHLAPDILRASHTIQGIFEIKKFERVRTNGRTEHLLRIVRYHEFIAVMGRNRVKVIVKQVEGGEPFFWSLIPFWGMNEDTKNRILHDGVPEED